MDPYRIDMVCHGVSETLNGLMRTILDGGYTDSVSATSPFRTKIT